MSEQSHQPKDSLTAFHRREEFVEAFEKAWSKGEQPRLEDFLPGQPLDRKAVLLDLVRVDLECRLKAGQAARAEDYLERYPELQGETIFPSSVNFACSGCGKKLRAKAELAGKKVKCPQCGKPLLVPQTGSADAASASTPSQPTITKEEKTWQPSEPRPPVDDSSKEGDKNSPTLAGADREEPLWDFLAPARQAGEIGRLGGYRVLQVLGAGGMGVVFRAEDPALQRPVALKAMLPSLASNPSAKERFFREARAAAALKHAHIVTIYQVGEDRGAPFLAMEFLEGESLEDRLRRDLKPAIAEILGIGRQIARGLAAAHDKGLIHRDIKPANIWLESVVSGPLSVAKKNAASATDHGQRTTDLHVKILDFGLARAVADQTHLTQTGAIIGTPAYMAPEQADGRPVDPRCDLFSLGCVLYRMYTGRLPFRGEGTIAILSALALENPPPPASLNPQVPAELSGLVMQLLAKKPEQRPESAQAVDKALLDMMDQLADRTPHPPTQVPKANISGTNLGEVPTPEWSPPRVPDTLVPETRSTKPGTRDFGTRKSEAPTLIPGELSAAPGGDPQAPVSGPPSTGTPFKKKRKLWALGLAAADLALAIIAAVVLFRVRTEEGEFLIETDDDQVAVAIDKQGGLLLIDRGSKQEYRIMARQAKQLPAGNYELVVTDPKAGLEFSGTRTFNLTRKGHTVRVKFENKEANAQKPPINPAKKTGDLTNSSPATPSPLDHLDAKQIPKEERFPCSRKNWSPWSASTGSGTGVGPVR